MLRKGGNLILAKFIIGPKLPHITEAYCFSVELFKQKVCIHGFPLAFAFIHPCIYIYLYLSRIYTYSKYGTSTYIRKRKYIYIYSNSIRYTYVRPTRRIATHRHAGRERRRVARSLRG